jgi:periplasmic copper chaperone A
MSRPTARRVAGASVLAIGLTTALAGPASAHVSVNPKTATQGGFSALTFRVPTEKDDASTTKLQVAFPADTPLASVSVKPVPGWTYQVTKSKPAQPVQTDDGPLTDAVSQITWTASSADTAVKPGEFQEFGVSAGPLPTTTAISFKALQTYSDGSVVRWIDTQTPGGPEAEHPAPTLNLTPEAADAAAPAAAPAAPATTTAAKTDTASKSSVNTAIGLGIAGIAFGALGGLLGGLALSRRRRATEASATRPDEFAGSGRI